MPEGINWDVQIGRRLRLKDLHAFLMIVQWGSMARAAEQLGVSQPAISKIVADLEHALAVRLLDRGRRGVEPTLYGRALANRAMIAFDELKQGVRTSSFSPIRRRATSRSVVPIPSRRRFFGRSWIDFLRNTHW